MVVMVVVMMLTWSRRSPLLEFCGRGPRFLGCVHERNSTGRAEPVFFTICASAGYTGPRSRSGFPWVHGFLGVHLERKSFSGLQSSGNCLRARPRMAHVLLQPGEKLIHGWIGQEFSIRPMRSKRRMLGRPGFFFVIHEGMNPF